MSLYKVETVRTFSGPNVVLSTKAVTFTLGVQHSLMGLDGVRKGLSGYFPEAKNWSPKGLEELFAQTVLEIQKLDMGLYVSSYSIESLDDGAHEVGVQVIDERTGKAAVYLAEDLLNNIDEMKEFSFLDEFKKLQDRFNKTLYGGPTISSIVDAACNAGIPMFYLPIEHQFQWGYGRRQIRGRSTTMSLDSIKDTEFTCYKDQVKEFLAGFGMPVPRGIVCSKLESAMNSVDEVGFPLVVKPVSGHKGQGVTTNIQSSEELEKAFSTLLEAGIKDGIIIEQQVSGLDHRLLTIGGRFVAALKREPAYVVGDGSRSIGQLIEEENKIFVRRDNARSPLTKIKIDDDLQDYLSLQDLALLTVPKKGEKIFLRRVANISAGGVSINVTDEIHPENIKLAECVAAFLRVHCLGVDVLADDITKSWRESPLAIIEINAGPGVFMHLAPAQGGSIDAPGLIMKSLFPGSRDSRIPICVFNSLSTGVRRVLSEMVAKRKSGLVVGSASKEGLFIDNEFVSQSDNQWTQVGVLLRHQSLDAALIEYTGQDVLEDGLRYSGADVACLIDASSVENVLGRDLQKDGWLITDLEHWPLENVRSDIKVYLIDRIGEANALPEGVQAMATVHGGDVKLIGANEMNNLPESAGTLSLDDRLILRCLSEIVPDVMSLYYPTDGRQLAWI